MERSPAALTTEKLHAPSLTLVDFACGYIHTCGYIYTRINTSLFSILALSINSQDSGPIADSQLC